MAAVRLDGDAKRITGNIQRHRLHRYRRSCLLDSSGQERRTFSTAAKVSLFHGLRLFTVLRL